MHDRKIQLIGTYDEFLEIANLIKDSGAKALEQIQNAIARYEDDLKFSFIGDAITAMCSRMIDYGYSSEVKRNILTEEGIQSSIAQFGEDTRFGDSRDVPRMYHDIISTLGLTVDNTHIGEMFFPEAIDENFQAYMFLVVHSGKYRGLSIRGRAGRFSWFVAGNGNYRDTHDKFAYLPDFIHQLEKRSWNAD